MIRLQRTALALTALFATGLSSVAGQGLDLPSVFLEELTWTEVRDAIDSGTTTIIIPTAGTEQNGPHMVLGKHKFIVNYASAMIARELGNALVAPVVTYVPEGDVNNPTRGHMSKAGTITFPEEFYMKLLEYGARSLAVHGFTDIVMIGDSGGNQRGMEQVADMLNAEWASEDARVHFVGDYYGNNGFREWLMDQGETQETIGGHAGISDTSQLLAVDPRHIRTDRLAPGGGFEDSGVSGDPTRASVERGVRGIQFKVDAALNQIRALMGSR
ncbi:MAG: creatininase family protein [Gemmatimonadota bacterium]|nr:creatininase family protein [Gemmatimonadota bacterium]MDE3006507.1 creatininase family protein [Gemmatimonadota bacterium]MDE3014148.1 creatininase family protein [Gemmatimonadota bacterium]